ncbi:MAG: hypothetical protein EHM64_10440 [Ignavibacteriae bacterium]|nr:MAG: hypothetical protein EHM64_10440 [Ignavibacteriota bacterium]
MDPIKEDESGLSSKMALCVAAITMVGIDGVFKEEELAKLRKLIHTDETAFLKAFSFYNDRPLDVCIKVVSAKLTDEQKRATYQILYELAQVDRDFAISEQDLLSQYAAEFRLTKEFVSSVKDLPSHNYNLTLFE